MKKTILSAAAVALTFVAFAFTPDTKRNTLDNAGDFQVTDLNSAQSTCETRYRTQESFSECDRTHTELETEQLAIQSGILAKY
ncbi:hypothetical protein LS482_03075 [Sinomicrobium kalidii]|uniref:hypothetical protein n=1 Tax=Sinomicrobium kalidii TaxID=2900738 RepID=UPI001E296B16|nr:hypothetical protein [Sinomicrobium kalidii]UGU16861.1 hypothetical protein LS482_03075 [Sinomicrobium kalidii]